MTIRHVPVIHLAELTLEPFRLLVRQLSLLMDCQADAKPDSTYWWQLEGQISKLRNRIEVWW